MPIPCASWNLGLSFQELWKSGSWIRFKNSAILLLRNYDGDNRWRLELVNEGDVKKARDGAYFVTPTNDNCQCDNTNIIFKGTASKFITENKKIVEEKIVEEKINKKYNIYIIRHGEEERETRTRFRLARTRVAVKQK